MAFPRLFQSTRRISKIDASEIARYQLDAELGLGEIIIRVQSTHGLGGFLAADTKHLHSRVDIELYEDLISLAKEKGFENISRLIRHVLKEWVNFQKKKLAEGTVDPFS